MNHLMCGVLRYNKNMSKDVSFSLDIGGGQQILTEMVAPTIRASTEAIAQRARSMASSISSNPPSIETSTTMRASKLGGGRIVGIVRATGSDAHQNYVGYTALAKAKDAGRV